MSKSCPNCNRSFDPFRKDQKYCSHSCRQQDYIKRKFGVLPEKEIKIEADVQPVLNHNALEKPTEQIISESEQNQLLTILGQWLGGLATGQQFDLSALHRTKNTNEIENVNDVLTDQSHLHNSVKRNSLNFNPKAVNDVSLHSNKETSFSVADMLRDQLTQTRQVDIFNEVNFPSWSSEQWKVVNLVNRRFVKLIDQLMTHMNFKLITKLDLKNVINELDEFQSGIISILLPENYPYFNMFKKVKEKMDGIIQQFPKKEKQAEMKISSQLADELIFIKMQISIKNP
jgi:hypothetical protein